MKKLFCLLAITMGLFTAAQETVSLKFTQDAKLAFVGDKEHGYDAGTPDFTIAVVMQGFQQKYGYVIVYPEFEYAALKHEHYRRWTVNVGYVFNKLIVKNMEAGLSLSYGYIDRGLTSRSMGGNAFLNYKISDSAKIILNTQLAQRGDLDMLYGLPHVWRLSGHVGFSVSFDFFKRLLN